MGSLLSRSKRDLRRCRAGATVVCRSARRTRERRLDERIDVAAKHAGRVADLDTGPVILHEGVGVEDVRADLTSPVRGPHLPAFLGLRRLLLAHLALQEACAKDLHSR